MTGNGGNDSVCRAVVVCTNGGTNSIHSTDLTVTSSVAPDLARNVLLGSASPFSASGADQSTPIVLTVSTNTATPQQINTINFVVSGVQQYYIVDTDDSSLPQFAQTTVTDLSAQTTVSIKVLQVLQRQLLTTSFSVVLVPADSNTPVTVSAFYIEACYSTGKPH